MKYLVKLNEDFNEIDSSLHLQKNAPKINRAELLALIDSAKEEGNWSQVKELLDLLKGTNESLILGWKGYALLLENVQDAKAILQKMVDAELRSALAKSKREDEVEGEDQTALNKEREEKLKERIQKKYLGPESDFEKIKKMLNFQGPISAFVRFRYQQGAPLEALENLQRLLVDLRDYVGQLPMTVDEYSKLAYSPETVAPGYEMLGDDLNNLLELRGGNWLISKLPKDARRKLIAAGLATGSPVNLRDEFKNSPRETQIELQKEASKLNALNKPHLLRLVLGQVPAKGSIADVLDLVKKTIKNAEDVGRDKILETAMNAYPSVAILYAEGDHFVFSFRNDAQLPFLCAKATGWCIQPSWYNKGYADRFWTYASGSLQLGIIDFTVDPSNPYHTVGATINPDRSVRSLCNQPNHCTSGGDYRNVFKNFNCGGDGAHSYPQEMIDAINENFDREVQLKTQSDDIYKKIKSYSEGERSYEETLAKTLIGMIRDVSSLTKKADLTSDNLKSNSEENVANQIVATEIKNLRNSPVMKKVQDDYVQKYSEGISILPSPADVKIFEIVLENSPKLTESLINNMIQKSKNVITALTTNLQKIGSGVETPLVKKIKVLLAGIDEAIIALEALKEKLKK